MLNRIHPISIICSGYERSKAFYTNIPDLKSTGKRFEKSVSHISDLALHGEYIIELFSFPTPPQGFSQPEATGLRHLAFEVDNLDKVIEVLKSNSVLAELARTDE
ncbi:MAG: VOC family protein [Ginsengibacter sp.]